MELSTIDHEANIHISHNKPQQGFEFFGLLISIIYLLYIIEINNVNKNSPQRKQNKRKKQPTIFFHWV
jgi:hypothetical protein